MQITYRPAEQSDANAIAPLMSEASYGTMDFLLNGVIPFISSNKILAMLVGRDDNEFSYKNTTVAEADGKVIAIANGYPAARHGVNDAMEKFIPNERLDIMRPFFNSKAPGSLYLCALSVAEKYRSQGIGTSLIDVAREQAKNQGLNKLSLHAWADNTRAIKLYESKGFHEVETFPIEKHKQLQAHEGGIVLMAVDLD